MFQMTADIVVELQKQIGNNGKPVSVRFKANTINWNVSIDNLCDSASFIIPALCRMTDKNQSYKNIQSANSGEIFSVGDKVSIYAGYDGKNDLQFQGFIVKIDFTVPLKVQCEGYSYQLKSQYYTKTFGKTTVRQVLNYILRGTDITLSEKMSGEIDFEAFPFKNKSGIQILEFLKEKYLLTVFFEYNKLYVGWLATYKPITVKHRLNWNVIKSDDLNFSSYTGSIVNIEVQSRKSTGELVKIKSNNITKAGSTKKLKVFLTNEMQMQIAANEAQEVHNKKGYSGSMLTFLKPFVRPGMTTQIIDTKYQERNGSYLIESVEGSFSPTGGRQKIGIAFKLS